MTQEEKRQTWLETRRQGIGGSDISAILGLNPWNTPLGVWNSKVNPPEEDNASLAMRIGTELEDLVAKLFCEETGKQVQKFNKTIIQDMFIGNVDRLVVPEGSKVASHKGEIRAIEGVECKTSSDAQWDEVPEYYQLQCQWYMGLIPSLTKMYVPVLFLKYKQFKIYEVVRDDELIASIQNYAREWWNKYVVGNLCPEAINLSEVQQAYPKSKDNRVELSLYERREISSLCGLIARKEKIEELIDKQKAEVFKIMGECDVLMHEGKKIATWKSNKDSVKVDYKAIVQELNPDPAIIEKHTTIKPGARVFKLFVDTNWEYANAHMM